MSHSKSGSSIKISSRFFQTHWYTNAEIVWRRCSKSNIQNTPELFLFAQTLPIGALLAAYPCIVDKMTDSLAAACMFYYI
jgi:hypothetical protein